MMDAPFPGALFRYGWDAVHVDDQGQAQRVRRKEELAADECSGRLRLEYESDVHRQQFHRPNPGQQHVHVLSAALRY